MTTEKELDKELPISVEELQKKRKWLEALNVEIWTIIEITPEIWDIIWTLYKDDQILARKVEVLGENVFKIEFVFPEYNLWKVIPDHVSIVQMQFALVQGLFTAIGFAIKQNGIDSPISYETYILNRPNTLYRRDERTMRRKIKFDERSYLIFKVNPIIKKGTTIYSIMIDIVKDKDTFLDGRVECVLQDQYLFDEREKNKFKDMKENEELLPNTMAGNVLTRFEANNNIRETITMTDFADKKDDTTSTKEEENK